MFIHKNAHNNSDLHNNTNCETKKSSEDIFYGLRAMYLYKNIKRSLITGSEKCRTQFNCLTLSRYSNEDYLMYGDQFYIVVRLRLEQQKSFLVKIYKTTQYK